jgi:hypothetical protein
MGVGRESKMNWGQCSLRIPAFPYDTRLSEFSFPYYTRLSEFLSADLSDIIGGMVEVKVI